MPLFTGTPLTRANWLFSMLDFDNDGYLHASDLVEAQRYADPLSDFGLELELLVNYYVTIHLKSKGKIKIADMINVHRFKSIFAQEREDSPEAKRMQAQQNKRKLSEDYFSNFHSCVLDEICIKSMSE